MKSIFKANKTEVKAFLKQIKKDPEIYFMAEDNIKNSPLFKSKAVVYAQKTRKAMMKKTVKRIMNSHKGIEAEECIKTFEKLDQEAKSYAEFLDKINGKKSILYTPDDLIVDNVLKLIKICPNTYFSVNTNFFTSDLFSSQAENSAILTDEQSRNQYINKMLEKKSLSAAEKALMVNETNNKRNEFIKKAHEKTENEKASILKQNITEITND